MTISLYDATVANFLQTLGAVDKFLAKALEHFRAQNIDPQSIVSTRFYDDMLPFRFQISQTVVHSVGAVDGVRKGVFTPKPDAEVDYAGLQQLVSEALATLNGISPGEVDGFVGRDMKFEFRDRSIPFTAENFLLSFSLPNFYFHAATAYDILRWKGVQLGKRDFMGQLRIRQ